MDVSEQDGNFRCLSEIRNLICSKYNLTKELRWRAMGRQEAGQSRIKAARRLNARSSVINKRWQPFLTTDLESRRSSQGRPRSTRSADD
ncbi:hypothetical protein TNCV_4629811 [Trichonephila clavipes]|nr:hypothetical protein TNCV_4629811 [Trichonephila clavipes]